MNRFTQALQHPACGWTVLGSAVGVWLGSFLERRYVRKQLDEAEKLLATHPDKTQSNWQIYSMYRTAMGIHLPVQLE